MERAKVIFGHLKAGNSGCPRNCSGRRKHFIDGDDDVVIIHALRTPLCKAFRGGFKDTYPTDLLGAVFSEILKQTGIPAGMLQDICIGNTQQVGAGEFANRMTQLYCDIPYTVPISSVNRLCSSGLEACANIAASIKAGYIDIGMAGGVESMTMNPMHQNMDGITANPSVLEHQLARTVLMPVGLTSENVATRFGITREQQDQMSVESHAKAARAQRNGWFDAEIVPVKTKVKDKSGQEKEVLITKDDGIRPGTNMEILAKLKPAFKEGGSSTAGNSCQRTDGASVVILARRSFAAKHNLPILGIFRAYTVVGVDPTIMGVGPAYAIPDVLRKTGLTVDDIDIFELNEAFASQAYYCVKKVGIPMEKVNPNGGAIALGHPFGCTGARQLTTLLHEMKRRGKHGYGVVSMCIGTGMGAAAVIEYPGN